MPTENRSSNTEMVSVPEGFMLVERSIWTEQQVEAATACITRLKGVPGVRDCDLAMAAIDAAQCRAPDIALSDLLPAMQPHPDPIAWMVGTAFWWTKEEAERDAADTRLPIVGLGPMVGPTPVERNLGEPVGVEGATFMGEPNFQHSIEWYREGISKHWKKICDLRAEVEQLRADLARCAAMASMVEEREWAEHVGTGPVSSKVEAAFTQLHNDLHESGDKLAKAQALLGSIAGWTAETRAAVLEAFQDELNDSASHAWYDAAIADLMNLVEAIPASAEPSAPVATDRSPELIDLHDLMERAATAIGQYGDSLLGRGHREESVDLLDLEREIRNLEQEFKAVVLLPRPGSNPTPL